MTYGWAILIIAVVLAALFQLGVFNSTNFAPKAPPGACQVFRPNGPGSTSFINLEGVCSGELPQFVGNFNGASSTVITVGTQSDLNIAGPLTVAGWANPSAVENGAIYDQNSCNSQYELFFDTTPNGNMRVANTNNYYTASHFYPVNEWVFVVGTFDGSYVRLYLNAALVGGPTAFSGSVNGHSGGTGYIGELPGCGYNFNGMIADVQIYNTSLSANDVTALYDEGIGGAPIDLQNLVGWWPLNGNANDYSGNNNNGVPTGVTFVSNWYSGYTPP